MESLFSGAKGSDALLEQLMADRVAPLEALSRIAAFHQGQSAGLVPFREGDVAAGNRHFPNPEDLRTLIGLLLVRVRNLFDESHDATDDFFVAGFLLWGLTAVHPFENGNGRTACDFTQYVLMGRWGASKPPLTDGRSLGHALLPVFVELGPINDGSAEAFLGQLQTLVAAFEGATLAKVKEIKGFRAIAQEIAARVNQSS